MYKVEQVSVGRHGSKLEAYLNEKAEEGWVFVQAYKEPSSPSDFNMTVIWYIRSITDTKKPEPGPHWFLDI